MSTIPLLAEFQQAIERAVAYGIISRPFDVAQAVDRRFPSNGEG